MHHFFYLCLAVILTKGTTGCVQKLANTSFVCVCDATQCDYLPGPSPEIQPGQFRVTKTSIDEFRLAEEVLEIEENNVVEGNIQIDLDTTVQFQTVFGFGGSFTDSSGLNTMLMSPEVQDIIIRSYYGPDGLDYNMARVPMAGSDYSPRAYSYDDTEGDVDLEFWALQDEDYNYKFPIMHRAIELSEQELHLFSSPWSPPAWMKTNGDFAGAGKLIPEMYQPWANYFIKFVEAYEDELGIPLWGITTQNEPPTGLIDDWGFNCCGWEPEEMRDWVKGYLGPTLVENDMRRIQVLTYDYNRQDLPEWPEPLISDPECSQYIDGISVHWYTDPWTPVSVLDQTQEQYPDKFILYTEAAAGWRVDDGVTLGSWERGEFYIGDIIENMDHWSTGYVDWNYALNFNGGPSWSYSSLDATIIINPDDDEIYIQPTHAAMGHFSRNVQRDAKKISLTTSFNSDDLRQVAFLNPDGTVVVVFANVGDTKLSYTLNDENGQVITREIERKTWETIVYLRER